MTVNLKHALAEGSWLHKMVLVFCYKNNYKTDKIMLK